MGYPSLLDSVSAIEDHACSYLDAVDNPLPHGELKGDNGEQDPVDLEKDMETVFGIFYLYITGEMANGLAYDKIDYLPDIRASRYRELLTDICHKVK